MSVGSVFGREYFSCFTTLKQDPADVLDPRQITNIIHLISRFKKMINYSKILSLTKYHKFSLHGLTQEVAPNGSCDFTSCTVDK